MTSAQLIIIAIGALLVITSIDLSQFKSYLKNSSVPVPKEPVKPIDPPAEDGLVSIVQKWKSLKEICEKNNLKEASAKLDEIFPMLIKVEKT